MTEKTKNKPHCRRCGVAIKQEEEDEAIKKSFLPLCEKCAPEIKEKLLKWQPLFQKFKP